MAVCTSVHVLVPTCILHSCCLPCVGTRSCLLSFTCLQPTPQLQRFFAACDYDMTELVAARIEQMAQAVFPLVPSSQHALQALQAAMNNERRQQVRV